MATNITTPLSRALVKQRKALQLSQEQVATGINRSLDKVQRYETGEVRPTPVVLELLGDVLQSDFCTAFPLAGTSEKELRQAANVKGRLHHLIGLVAGGGQQRFAAGTGLSATRISNAMNGRQPLASAHLDSICRVLPGLNRQWMETGKGEPFAEGQVPTLEKPSYSTGRSLSVMGQYDENDNQPPLYARSAAKSRKAAKPSSTKKHPNAVGPMVQEVLEVSVYDQCSMTGNFTFSELDELPFSTLNKMVATLRTFAGAGCGLTSSQVEEVGNFLAKLARKYGE